MQINCSQVLWATILNYENVSDIIMLYKMNIRLPFDLLVYLIFGPGNTLYIFIIIIYK